ncbi:MAG TPA: porin family protein [Ignavibacteria bacterium]|nr:porin family protein [Ignavibacteria bacterium]HQY51904.1 porin family protein [Ignavibacteria bacterium]HRA99977.1 porin family protein [Ignavibacteria bacterium]
MKKLNNIALLIIVLLIVFASNNSNAQVKIALGLQAGVNFGNASNNVAGVDQTLSSSTGFIAGGLVDIGLSKQISIVPGLRYIGKGSKQTNVAVQGLGNGDLKTTIGMLEFPALLRVKFPLTEVNPYLIAGPILGIILSANTDFIPTAGGTTQSFDVKSTFESTEFDLYFGGGLDFKISPSASLFFELGYELGLTDIAKASNVTTKSYSFQITGGARFGM